MQFKFAVRVTHNIMLSQKWAAFWRSVVGRISEVNPRRARLVLGWVTFFGQANHLGM